MRLRELLTENILLKALGGMIDLATKAKHYPTGNLDQLKAIHQSANTATKMGTDTAKHTELAVDIAKRDLAAQNIASQRNAMGARSIKNNPELEAAENKLLDMQKTINDKTNDLLINKDLGPTQSSNSGMARWKDNSDTQGVLSGNSKGSHSIYATPAEQRRIRNLNSKIRRDNMTPEQRARYLELEKKSNQKARSTPEKRAKEQERNRASRQKRLDNMNSAERKEYLKIEKESQRKALKKSRDKQKKNRTPEETEEIRKKGRIRYAKKQEMMSPEEKAIQQKKNSIYHKQHRENMTPEQRATEKNTRSQRISKMTPKELAVQRENAKLRMRRRIENMTPKELAVHREKVRIRNKLRYDKVKAKQKLNKNKKK